MTIESIAFQGLYTISLALSANEKWKAAKSPFGAGSTTEILLTGFAVAALLVSEMLLFWVFSKYRRSEQQLNKKITELTVTNVKQRQENERTTATNKKLEQDIADLTAANEKLRQENIELKSHVEVV